MAKAKKFSLWTKKRANGERELRASSKALISLVAVLLSFSLYQGLILFGETNSGAQIIEVLAYVLIVLVVALSLLTLIVSLIDYLRSFEEAPLNRSVQKRQISTTGDTPM